MMINLASSAGICNGIKNVYTEKFGLNEVSKTVHLDVIKDGRES